MTPLEALAAAGFTNPEEVQKARDYKILKDLQALMATGLKPDQISQLGINAERYGGAEGLMNLGGGYGLIDPALTSAGIASSYSLGRANLAAQLAAQRFAEQEAMAERAGNPYNSISYLEGLKATGTARPLNSFTGNILTNPHVVPDSPERKKLSDFLVDDDPEPFAAGGALRIPEPAVVQGVYTKRPYATLAENGAEDLTQVGPNFRVTPLPGTSRKLGRVRQQKILDAMNRTDPHVPPKDMTRRVPSNPGDLQTPIGPKRTVGNPGDQNGDGVINAADRGIFVRDERLRREAIERPNPPYPDRPIVPPRPGAPTRSLADEIQALIFSGGASHHITSDDPRYDPRLDFNGNGVISNADALLWKRQNQSQMPVPMAGGGWGSVAGSSLGRKKTGSAKAANMTREQAEAFVRYDTETAAKKATGNTTGTAAGAARTPGPYYGFDTAEEAMAYRDKTAGASDAERAVLNKWGTESGLVNDDRRAQPNPNNVVYRYDAAGNIYVDENADAGQRGSTTYNQDGSSRPTTQADIDAYNKQSRQQIIDNMGYGSSDPNKTKENSRTVQMLADAIYKDGGLAIYGYNADGSMRNRESAGRGAERYDRDGNRVGLGGQTSGGAYERGQAQQGDAYPNRGGGLGRTRSTPATTPSTPTAGGSPTTDSQRELALLMAPAIEQLQGVSPELVATLKAGKVPSLNMLTYDVWSAMPSTLRANLVSLLKSTGWVGTEFDIDETLQAGRPR